MVGLQLAESGLQIGIFIGGVFEFDYHQRQTIDEQDDIRAFVDVVFDHGVLVHRQKIVVLRVVKVNQPDLVRAAFALPHTKFHVDTFR